jgi:hypothetical protein
MLSSMNYDYHPSLEWAAGLFEGEGCIYVGKNASTSRSKQVALTLASADFDVLETFCGVVECGTIRDFKGTVKPMKKWSLAAQDEVLELLVALRPMLGDRRRAKADEAIDFIYQKRKDRKSSYVKRGLARRKSCGHPRPVENCCQR